jgi:hypothetical protein
MTMEYNRAAQLKHAISAIPPDQRRREIDNALREVERDERDQKLWEWFGNLPIEDKEALFGKGITTTPRP